MVLELIAIVVLAALAGAPPAQRPILIEVTAADLDRCRMTLADVLVPAGMPGAEAGPPPQVRCVVSE